MPVGRRPRVKRVAVKDPSDKGIAKGVLQDQIDDFHERREKIMLNNDDQDSDEELEDELPEDEDVLDLGDDDEDDEDDFDDDDDDDDDIERPKPLSEELGIKNKDEDWDEEKLNLKWGSKRNFYVDEAEGSDQEEADREEEAEAKRLQKKKLAGLSQADFALADDSFAEILNNKQQKKTSLEDKKILDSVNRDLDAISLDFDQDATIEQVKKNLKEMSKQEIMQLIVSDSPELLQLLKDFQEKLTEIKENLAPILNKVKNGEVPTSKGISFMELKFHLLLSYCTNISFYLLMKAGGKSVKNHPVIDELVKIRTILEKIKPIDQKLKYQVDKLLKTAAMGNIQHTTADPLKLKANPSALVDEEEEEEEEDGGVYKPPKLASATFDDDKPDEEEKREFKQRERAAKSKMLRFLADEYTDKPPELGNVTSSSFLKGGEKEDPKEKEKTRFEEDNFVRIPVTKAELKKKKKLQGRLADEFADLEDFGDLEVLDRQEESQKKKSIAAAVSQLTRTRRQSTLGGDSDLPYHDPEEIKMRKKRRNNEFDDDERPSKHKPRQINDQDEDEFYQQVKKAKQTKRADRDEESQRVTEKKKSMINFKDDSVQGDKRGITWEIKSNKGLTPHRPKKYRNSRVKLREKYDVALKKRKGQVRDVKQREMNYGGETSGINPRVARSRPLA